MTSASRLDGRAKRRRRGRGGERAEAPRVELQRACTAGERLREVVMRPRGEKFPCALAVRRAGAIGGEPCGGVAGGRGSRRRGGTFCGS